MDDNNKELKNRELLLSALQIAQTQYLHFSTVRHALITFLFTSSFGFYYVALSGEALRNGFAAVAAGVLYVAALCLDFYFARNTYESLQKCKALGSLSVPYFSPFTSYDNFLQVVGPEARPEAFCYRKGTVAKIVSWVGWPLAVILLSFSVSQLPSLVVALGSILKKDSLKTPLTTLAHEEDYIPDFLLPPFTGNEILKVVPWVSVLRTDNSPP